MIWGRCSDAHTNRLLKLQKRAPRIILQADIMTPSKSMFKELQWLSFPKRIKYHTCIMMYKTLTDMPPDYMSELFKKAHETHGRNLRSANNDMLKVPFSHTRYYDRSFAIQGATEWNSLPLDIRKLPSLTSSKHNVKKHLHQLEKGTSRQRSGKGAIRKRFPLQKPRWEKKQTNNQVLIP